MCTNRAVCGLRQAKPGLEIYLVKTAWAGQKRLGVCGQQLVTSLYSKVQIHMEYNGTLWQ